MTKPIVPETETIPTADTDNDKSTSVMKITEEPTPTPKEEIFDWVEYENDDGTYTKGSELKEQSDTGVTKAEDKKLKESDILNLPTVSEADLQKYQAATSGYYFYKRLNAGEQKLYGEMMCILSNHLEGVKISTLDVDLVNRVYEALWKDHGEMFFVEGCSYVTYLLNDEPAALCFNGVYSMDESETIRHQAMVDQYTNNVISQYQAAFPGGSDDYEKIKFWYEYIINHTEYDIQSPDNQNILSVMENGRSVCQGYARATQYVLSKMGIETILVVGTGKSNEVHAWNEVFADGAWYHIDTTWGDASYEVKGDVSLAGSVPPVNYDYLLVNDAEISKTHGISNKGELPAATAMADNYYVREGTYFTEVNPEQVGAAFAYAKARGLKYVTLKMDSGDTYQKMRSFLLEDQKVFDYLDGSSTVSYAVNQEQNYMVFWL